MNHNRHLHRAPIGHNAPPAWPLFGRHGYGGAHIEYDTAAKADSIHHHSGCFCK